MEKNTLTGFDFWGIWTRIAHLSRHMGASSPDFTVVFEVHGEDKVSVRVRPRGVGDHHVLSRLQAVKLSQLPLTILEKLVLHSRVFLEEETL